MHDLFPEVQNKWKKWKIANVRPEKKPYQDPKTTTDQEIQGVTTQLCLQNKATLLIRGTKGELKDDKHYTFIQHSFSFHLAWLYICWSKLESTYYLPVKQIGKTSFNPFYCVLITVTYLPQGTIFLILWFSYL